MTKATIRYVFPAKTEKPQFDQSYGWAVNNLLVLGCKYNYEKLWGLTKHHQLACIQY